MADSRKWGVCGEDLAKQMYVGVLYFLLLMASIALLTRHSYPDMSAHHADATEHKFRTASTKPLTLKPLLPPPSEAEGGVCVCFAQFSSMCTSCHTENKAGTDDVGPNLWGAVLRRVASLPSFAYSPSLARLPSSRWGFGALNKFLKQPTEYAFGTYMTFSGLAEALTRTDVLRYLNLLSHASDLSLSCWICFPTPFLQKSGHPSNF
ncbi:MAG: c-type cytochrome [Candidatus Hodgkinia cicadicola]